MSGRRSELLQRLLLIALAVVLVGAVALDWRRMQPVLGRANWRVLPAAIVFSLVSYVCSGSGFAIISRTFGVPVATRRLFLVGFVTMTVNNLITLVGAAGYGVSAALLKRPEVRLRDVLAASVFNSYAHFFIGTTFLPLSLVYVVAGGRMPRAAQTGMTAIVSLALVLAVTVNLAVFSRTFRAGLFRFLSRAARFFVRRDPSNAFARFDSTFTEGMARLKAKPARLAGLFALIAADWTTCIAALWFCFAALGSSPHAGVVASGFFIGIAAGAASMLPGGMGVQEGSMAGVYALLGIPFRVGLLASILFRAVYYFLPFVLGLVIYWSVLVRARAPASPDN